MNGENRGSKQNEEKPDELHRNIVKMKLKRGIEIGTSRWLLNEWMIELTRDVIHMSDDKSLAFSDSGAFKYRRSEFEASFS